MNPSTPTAVVAEDEPLLRDALLAELAAAWPALRVVAAAGNGDEAWDALLAHRPDVAFLDIRMPGMNGLEVAQAIAEDWPDDAAPPLIVFVTAYEAHALEAFDLAAVDYVLKPVQPARLARTVARLQSALAARSGSPGAELAALAQRLAPLLGSLQPTARAEPLRQLAAGVGNRVRLIPLDAVVYLQAADKYVNVVTTDGEALLRTPLAALAPRLDARFARVHRGTIVNLDQVLAAERDEAGRVRLLLRGRPEKLPVSRLHAERFRAM